MKVAVSVFMEVLPQIIIERPKTLYAKRGFYPVARHPRSSA